MSNSPTDFAAEEATGAVPASLPTCESEPRPACKPAWFKPVVTCWLLFHLSGVIIYPASIPTPSTGLLSTLRRVFFDKYMEALYMVQGHRFFAPEPGPGQLVAYRVERADGSFEENIFPRREISPRLLYHRYFMLSERSQDIVNQNGWFRMYGRRLAHEYGAERVKMWRVIHRLADPQDILNGKKLSDEEFYEQIELGDWDAKALAEPWEGELPEPIEEGGDPDGETPINDAVTSDAVTTEQSEAGSDQP